MAVAGRLYGPEWRRYSDPATDFDVIRLTDPAYASGMTAPHLKQFSRRGNFLLHWSERSGARQAYQLDLKSGESRQLTDVQGIDGSSLTLSPDDRTVYFSAASSLTELTLGSLRTREIHKATGGPITVAFDGSVLLADNASVARIMRQRPTPAAFDAGGPVDLLIARPRRSQVLYRTGGVLSLANLDGSGKRQLKTEPGQTGEVLWSPSGQSLIYLHIPEDPKQLISLRENFPDENTDKQLAKTSQFAGFGCNSDASVFTGASRSRASAYVLILLRVTRRELTLCEHRASDPAMVKPAFSPDSQSVFFVSDRHGKQALYRVRVEKFVEQTDDDN